MSLVNNSSAQDSASGEVPNYAEVRDLVDRWYEAVYSPIDYALENREGDALEALQELVANRNKKTKKANKKAQMENREGDALKALQEVVANRNKKAYEETLGAYPELLSKFDFARMLDYAKLAQLEAKPLRVWLVESGLVSEVFMAQARRAAEVNWATKAQGVNAREMMLEGQHLLREMAAFDVDLANFAFWAEVEYLKSQDWYPTKVALLTEALRQETIS